MTILELKEERLNLQNELTQLIENGEAEKRELNDNETSRMAEIRTKIAEVDTEIENIEAENRKLAEIAKTNNNKTKENRKMEVRLFDLIKEVANGNVKDEHRQFVQGNNITLRDIQADTEDHGAENVPVYKQPLEVAIRNASVLDKVGASWFRNAVGDVKLVKYQGSNCAWAGSENADAVSGDTAFEEVTLTPKRLTSYITISRQFLDQSPEDAEAILVNDLARAIGNKIDETVFGAGSGSTAEPAGMFAGDYVTSGTALTAMTFEDVLALEEAVEEHNGNDFIFVTDPKVKYALRGTMMAANLSPIFANGEIDGRKTVVSNSVNDKSVLCFDPKDLACASWGNGINIIVDPYTLAGKNMIKVTVNYLFDAALKGDRISGAIFS